MSIKKLSLILLSCLLVSISAEAQRVKISINDCWTFSKERTGSGDVVSFPHTWNAQDTDDETSGYLRAPMWYTRTIQMGPIPESKAVTVHFEGANQVTTLYVNGNNAGTHVGGYTAFAWDITEFLHEGDNLFEICVDNSYNKDIPPLSADFTFYGGVYRDVYLITTPSTHISTTHYAADGVYAHAAQVTASYVLIDVDSRLSYNIQDKKPHEVTLQHRIYNAEGKEVASAIKKLRLKGSSSGEQVNTQMRIDMPELWSIDSPCLYRIETTLEGPDGIDNVAIPFGVRTYNFDAQNGFTLNGEHFKLMGTSRHQDYYRLGNALSDEMHERDIRLLHEMGGNYLRVCHYPQDPVVLQCCDRLGIVTSVEIPIINAITPTSEFKANCVQMAEEMLWQNRNHPSVTMWSYMNESLLRPPYKNDVEKEEYFRWLCDIAQAIDDTFRKSDPERFTIIPCHSDEDLYFESGIAEIPQMLGFNIYDGWYRKTIYDFGTRLGKIHKMWPDKPLIVTEYGADVDPRIHSFAPERYDFSSDLGMKYHEHYAKVIHDLPYISGSAVWNLNDFYSEARGEAVPHVNNKGLVGLSRTPKDAYYLYQALLSDKKVIHICGSDWRHRRGEPVQDFRIYTNVDSADVILNGSSIGLIGGQKSPIYEVPLALQEGKNTLLVTSSEVSALYEFDYHDETVLGDDFVSLGVVMGTSRYFEDPVSDCTWVPERKYSTGSWGYIGKDDKFLIESNRGIVPASVADILGTENDPVYQSQRIGIEEFRADVPDGKYDVYLYFAELLGVEDRVFGVDVADPDGSWINNIESLNVASTYGHNRAVCIKLSASAQNGSGIRIRFVPQTGEPMLNAIRVYRNL